MFSPSAGQHAEPVAIVTGGSRGVGRAVGRRLGRQGFAVVVGYLHDQRAAESTVDLILAERGEAMAVRGDVADPLDVERLFDETRQSFGGVDVVTHCVGPRLTGAPLTRTNIPAAFVVCREAARRVRTGGAIVAVSSSVPAANAATVVLTRALAGELRPRDITVNAVVLDAGRPCRPGRVADMVAYLVGERGRGLSGAVIRLDDGGCRGTVP